MTKEQAFRKNCKRYLEIGNAMSPLEKEKKALKKDIDAFTEGNNVTSKDVMVEYFDVKGSIDIEALLADHPEIDIEKYRKKPTKRIGIKLIEA